MLLICITLTEIRAYNVDVTPQKRITQELVTMAVFYQLKRLHTVAAI